VQDLGRGLYNARGTGTSSLDKPCDSSSGLVLRGNPVVDGWLLIPARKRDCADAQRSWRITGWLKNRCHPPSSASLPAFIHDA